MLTPHSFKLGLKLNSLTVSSKDVCNKLRPSYVKISSSLAETSLDSKHTKQSFSYIQLNGLQKKEQQTIKGMPWSGDVMAAAKFKETVSKSKTGKQEGVLYSNIDDKK